MGDPRTWMRDAGLAPADQARLLRETGALLEQRSRRSAFTYVAFLLVVVASSPLATDHPRATAAFIVVFVAALAVRLACADAWRRSGHDPALHVRLFAAPFVAQGLALSAFTAWTAWVYPSHWLPLVAHMATGFGALSAIIAYAPARATTLVYALCLVVPADVGTALSGAAVAPTVTMMGAVFVALVLPMLFRLSRDHWDARIGRAVVEDESRRKSELLATISHELKTPMHGVLGTAELLLRTPLTAEQKAYVDAVRTSADALQLLANDLLDAALIEAGRLRVVDERFGARALLTSVVDLLAPEARGKGLALEQSIDPALPDDLVGDALRLRQVLVNLLANAVKYTDRGRVVVRARGEAIGEGRLRLVVVVEDTGPGIDDASIAGLFVRWSRGASTKRGAGLGLGIARELVERMGGRIEARSGPTGTTFTFAVPVGVAAFDGATAAAALRGARVLLVDDVEVNLLVARALLTTMGCVVTTATSGDEAVATAAASEFDVVLMDCQMPGTDGYAATAAIRAAERGRRTPIVAVTAERTDEAAARCRAVGMDDLVGKPVTADALARALSPLLVR